MFFSFLEGKFPLRLKILQFNISITIELTLFLKFLVFVLFKSSFVDNHLNWFLIKNYNKNNNRKPVSRRNETIVNRDNFVKETII